MAGQPFDIRPPHSQLSRPIPYRHLICMASRLRRVHPRRRQESAGGARRAQDAPGEPRRRQESPGGARESPGGARRSQAGSSKTRGLSPSGPKLSPRLHEKCIFYQNRCLATAPIIFLFLGRPRQIRAVAKMPWRLRESFIFLEKARFTTVPLMFGLRQQRLPDGLRRVSRRYC